jgi:hypothetical protein
MEPSMTNPPADWQQIGALLKNLNDARCEIRGLCSDEFEQIDNAVHYANKTLDGFAFVAERQHIKGDAALATIRIDLTNLGEGEALPWSYRATFYYAGHKDTFFARTTSEGTLQAVERAQSKIGSSKDEHWQWVLQVIAQLNLRDTPRRAILV